MTSITVPLVPSAAELPDAVDFIRLEAAQLLDQSRRSQLGQFFTPMPIARLIASLSAVRGDQISLLDAGAGVGVLTAAWIAGICSGARRPSRIRISAFEVDTTLVAALDRVLGLCRDVCERSGIWMEYAIHQEDFIRASAMALDGGLFSDAAPQFDCAVLNPPYKKFRSDSEERSMLREVGIETSNLYTAFVALALRSVREGGELIAITPRSFCNGPYFTPFRKNLLRLSNLTHIHVFDARDRAFAEDKVLQENVIFRVERGKPQGQRVVVEWSERGIEDETVRRQVPFSEVVRPNDTDAFIHIRPDDWDTRIADLIEGLTGTLSLLHVRVSTGRVVDFRAKQFLRTTPEPGTVPLIYPTHFVGGSVVWPKSDSKKPNAIELVPSTGDQINRIGVYVLVKRFSSKEERRRIVAALLTPEAVPGDHVAFENHINYFHRDGSGLPRLLAAGLTAYLNSTVVDSYFRQFNGHTQVNATDLRKLHYPAAEQLERIGVRVLDADLTQEQLDDLVERELLDVAEKAGAGSATIQQRIAEAIGILKAIGLPREQQNERSALTLLALLALKPSEPWSSASNPMCGVTPIMEFAAEHYGKRYAPNTRETVRRYTLHQFRDAGLVVANPDKPGRPVNSPAYCYQVPSGVRDLFRSYGSRRWKGLLRRHLSSAGALSERYANERQMRRIPLRIREGVEITLSPGGQNELIKEIIDQFCPRFTPGARLLYIGDAGEKWSFFEEEALQQLGVRVDAHGKMPDVVVHYEDENWLVLVEAVTSHGPVNPKRRGELKKLFAHSAAPLVFVTAFKTRQILNRYLSEIAWETEVWVAEAPSHMIHFNGERFLGPYE